MTSRYGVAPMRPERTQSAKGRLETPFDAIQNREFCNHLNINGINDGSSEAKKTHSSTVKILPRRPLSAVSSKAKSLEEDRKKQRPKKNASKCLKAKADLSDDSGDMFKFEIQGASIQNSSTRNADNSQKSSQSNTSNCAEDVHAGCNNNEKEQPKSSALWSSLMQSEIGDLVKESCVQISEGDSSCFLTAVRDEPEDDSETVHVHMPGDSRSRRSRKSSRSRALRHRSATKSDWFSVKPCVYNMELTEESADSSNVRKDEGDFPYKLNAQPKAETSIVPVVSDLVEDMTLKSHLGRPIPQTLVPLKEFIQVCSAENEKKLQCLTGINSDNCLVFLPDLDTYDLAIIDEVPSVQHVDDDLPYKERVVSPKLWAPKKYAHTFKPIDVPKWKCNHNKGHTESSRYIDRDRKRTVELVRKEILELEELLKGIAVIDSECLMALYQADITKLQATVKDTLMRCPERIKPREKPDHFGWRKFHNDHEVIIKRIREQHAVCLKELAKLEEEADLTDERRYFSIQMNAVVTCDQPV
ncbi:uncharacterized protein LOC135475215 [Liolophura sinensis]|uniref:uncharacterized protein LOC135475215 n=1 Tax=Liolophura sinensis TaxID=3198878 RepID=UPI0031595DCF